jgi:hypothetical protein
LGQKPEPLLLKSIIWALLATGLDVYEHFLLHGRGHRGPKFLCAITRQRYQAAWPIECKTDFIKRRLAAHPPMHGILGVLQKIRARRAAKLVSR